MIHGLHKNDYFFIVIDIEAKNSQYEHNYQVIDTNCKKDQ
jgi:hypothetical protein